MAHCTDPRYLFSAAEQFLEQPGHPRIAPGTSHALVVQKHRGNGSCAVYLDGHAINLRAISLDRYYRWWWLEDFTALLSCTIKFLHTKMGRFNVERNPKCCHLIFDPMQQSWRVWKLKSNVHWKVMSVPDLKVNLNCPCQALYNLSLAVDFYGQTGRVSQWRSATGTELDREGIVLLRQVPRPTNCIGLGWCWWADDVGDVGDWLGGFQRNVKWSQIISNLKITVFTFKIRRGVWFFLATAIDFDRGPNRLVAKGACPNFITWTSHVIFYQSWPDSYI